jgi:hypothetical protein
LERCVLIAVSIDYSARYDSHRVVAVHCRKEVMRFGTKCLQRINGVVNQQYRGMPSLRGGSCLLPRIHDLPSQMRAHVAGVDTARVPQVEQIVDGARSRFSGRVTTRPAIGYHGPLQQLFMRCDCSRTA